MNYIQIIFDLILTILGLYLAFGKSYFSEKGKNLATKEDIGIITREIETVKNEVSFSTQRKSEFLKEKIDVALAFNDQAAFFIDYSSKVIDILANNSSNLELILKQTEDIRLQGAKLISSFLKIYIYNSEELLRKSAENYYNSAVRIQQLAITVLFQLEQLAQKEAIMMNSFKNGYLQFENDLTELVQNRKVLIENHISERKKLIDNEVYKVRGIYINALTEMVRIKE
jgi:hypothetical protein